MMARAKIKELLSHLDDTKDYSEKPDITRAVSVALENAREVIDLFEKHCKDITHKQRVGIADHLWHEHLKGERCSPCPHQQVLAGWWGAVNATQQWHLWEGLFKGHANKPVCWSAAKFLSIYLSLTTRGFDEREILPLKVKNGRLILVGGNNRVRILGALGQLEVEVSVSTPL